MKARTTRQIIMLFFIIAVVFCTLTTFNKCAELRAEPDQATGTITEEWAIYYEYAVINGDTIPVDTIGKLIYQGQPDQWPGTAEQWQEFNKCIENYPSDAVCDSCYQAIMNRQSI
jgi:hypothetical protein